MAARLAQLLVLGACMVGCSSSRHFPDESRDAEHAIDRAEDAGATEHSRMMLAEARDTLDNARKAEEDAIRDRRDAREQLHASQRRAETSEQRLDIRHRQHDDLLDQRKVQLIALDRQKERREELERKNLGEEEIRRLTETETALVNLRLRSVDASIASVEKELELLELEKKDAQLGIDAARARLATAEQRLQVARLLFQRAEDQAKVAEAESIDANRLGLRARLTEM